VPPVGGTWFHLAASRFFFRFLKLYANELSVILSSFLFLFLFKMKTQNDFVEMKNEFAREARSAKRMRSAKRSEAARGAARSAKRTRINQRAARTNAKRA